MKINRPPRVPGAAAGGSARAPAPAPTAPATSSDDDMTLADWLRSRPSTAAQGALRPRAAQPALQGDLRPRVALPAPAARSTAASSSTPVATVPPAASMAGPAAGRKRQTQGERLNVLWNSGATRKREFGDLRQAYIAAQGGKDITGGRFLAVVLNQTKARDAQPFDSGHPNLKGFTIRLPGTDEAVHVLRRDEGDNNFVNDLRRPLDLSPTELQRLGSEMSANASMGQRISGIRQGAQKLAPRSGNLWRYGLRSAEFADLHQAARQQMGGRLSGGAFLDMLYRLTLADSAKKTKVHLPTGPDQPDIGRFEIQVPGTPEPVQVLRRLDDDGELADLRLSKSAASEGYVLDQMLSGAQSSRAQKEGQGGARKPSAKLVQNARHWSLWRPLEKQLGDVYEAHRLHAQAAGKGAPTGSMFVKLLGELCDKADGQTVDAARGITRHEVRVDGWPQPVALLRRMDHLGLASLRRLGPGMSEAQAMTSMLQGIRKPSASTALREPSASSSTAAAAPKRRLDPDTEATVPAKRPRTARPELTKAVELEKVLDAMLGNQRAGRPVMQDVARAAGVDDAAVRKWFEEDGSLSRKRKKSSFVRLKGYSDTREELFNRFFELGQADAAQRMPQEITASMMLAALRTRRQERYIDQSITTNATLTRDGKLTIAHDTDSDSDS